MAEYKGIKGYKVQSRASDPTVNEGQIWYNTASSTLKYDTVAAGAWAAGGIMPGTKYFSGSMVGTQTASLYGGGNPGNVGNAYTYDGAAWTVITAMTTGRANIGSSGAGTQTAGIIYGGEIPGSPGRTPNTEEWNGSSWSEKANLGNERYAMAGDGTSTAALCVDGAYPSGTTLVESWDGSSWTAGTASNYARYALQGGGTQTSFLACGGKAGPATTYATSDEWNGTSWTTTPALNTGRQYGTGAAASGTSCLIFGGEAPPPHTKKTELWNGTSWTELADLTINTQKNAGSGTSALALSVGNESPNDGASYEWNSAPTVVKTVTVS